MLTDGSDYIQAFSATPSANGLQVMVNRLAVTGDGSTGDPYGEARMDILDLTLGCDLAVKDVYCDMQYYVAGNKLPVTVTVANKGRQAVSQIKVTFLAENGTELGTETLDISLPAGVTQEIETGFTVKDVVQGQKITVQVTPVDNTDINTADNAAELTLQQHDIALADLKARLAEMAQNPAQTAAFFREKFCSQWMEPTMGMLWNGALSEHTGAFGETAARFFAKDHTALETLLGAFQRALYAFSAAGIIGMLRDRKRSGLCLLLPLIFFGGALYHLLFEAKSQYAFPYAVLLLPIAAMGICRIEDGLKGKRA